MRISEEGIQTPENNLVWCIGQNVVTGEVKPARVPLHATDGEFWIGYQGCLDECKKLNDVN